MELTIFKRTDTKKGTTNRLKIEGNIPAVMYGCGLPTENIYIYKREYEAALRHILQGKLSTTIFTLKEGNKKHKAIIKEVQYHLTSYQVQHIDFEILQDKVFINVNVPVFCINTAECHGVKLGGMLRQVIRKLKVKCLPKHIPEEFTVDVLNLGIMESIKLAQLSIPKGVTPLARLDQVVAVVAKR